EAGYGDGFEVELLCQPTSPRKEIATQVQEDLAEIGIEINIKQTVASQMYEVYRSQDHEMIVAGWGVDYADAQSLTMPFAHCRTASDEAEVKQLAWRNMAENPELTDLVESANKEMDEEKRLEMFKEIQHDVLDWGPFAITFYPVQQNVMKDTVKGYQLPPNPTYLEFENVYKE
ncbi:MAG: ABC transporter substrate-binding protein, partial [Candidatus Acetothermia bacterium]